MSNRVERTIYVGRLPYDANELDLKDYFTRFGRVVRSSRMDRADGGGLQPFAFVEFATVLEAENALDYTGHKINNAEIIVGRSVRRGENKWLTSSERRPFIRSFDHSLGSVAPTPVAGFSTGTWRPTAVESLETDVCSDFECALDLSSEFECMLQNVVPVELSRTSDSVTATRGSQVSSLSSLFDEGAESQPYGGDERNALKKELESSKVRMKGLEEELERTKFEKRQLKKKLEQTELVKRLLEEKLENSELDNRQLRRRISDCIHSLSHCLPR